MKWIGYHIVQQETAEEAKRIRKETALLRPVVRIRPSRAAPVLVGSIRVRRWSRARVCLGARVLHS
jgi:hypothetical protein